MGYITEMTLGQISYSRLSSVLILLSFSAFFEMEKKLWGADQKYCSELLIRGLNPTAFLTESQVRAQFFTNNYDEKKVWADLKSPLFQQRQVGIDYIKKIVQEKGISTVVPAAQLRRHEHRLLEYLYGTQILFAGRVQRKRDIHNVPGVVMHPGNAAKLSESFRGEVNPHLGISKIYHSIDKWTEYKRAEAIMPGAMPKTVQAVDYLQSGVSELIWVREFLNELLSHPNRVLTHEENKVFNEKLSIALKDLFEATKTAFPPTEYPLGSFIKLTDEIQTGDEKKTIRSIDPLYMTWPNEFLSSFLKFRREERIRSRMSHSEIALELNDSNKRSVDMVSALVWKPESILFQEAVSIAKTELGYPMEFRFVFLEDELLKVFPRHTVEYLPDEIKKVEEFLKSYFSQIKSPLPLAGAGDLALLENGGYKIIEFNYGTEGGEFDASFSPIRSNQVTSVLLGHPTPLLQDLERAFWLSPLEQRQFLRRVMKSVIKYAPEELGIWFRDRYIQQWEMSPSIGNYELTVKNLKYIFEELFPRKDKKIKSEILRSANSYMKKKLLNLVGLD